MQNKEIEDENIVIVEICNQQPIPAMHQPAS